MSMFQDHMYDVTKCISHFAHHMIKTHKVFVVTIMGRSSIQFNTYT